MNRETIVDNHLSSLPKESLRVCKTYICACLGCVGSVDGKSISEEDLKVFLTKGTK